MRKISICCPTFNRYEMTVNCVTPVLNDDRVSEIIIVDDCSTDDSYEKLQWHFRDTDKVKLSRNASNLDCYYNKYKAVLKASNEFVCLWDSDNTFGSDYIDTIYNFAEWDKHTFYLPEWARPAFSALEWSGLAITKENVAKYADTHLMTNLNAMNFFINREEYLRLWNGSVNAGTSDSIFFSLTWLKANNKILITPNLQYDHRLHEKKEDGHYTTHQHKYVDFHNDVMQQIRQLK